MKDRDEWKAAFWTNRGLYEPLVMFFGLTNSLATFQTMMDGIFEDLISEGVVVVYLDDILIFTKTLEEHQKVVRRVMEVLQKYGLSLKPEKCEFERTSVEYLGVVVSHDSVRMAYSVKQERSPIVPGVHQLLPKTHRRLFAHCSPPLQSD